MRRSEIKADGTVYADQRGNPIRVADGGRLWDQGSSRHGSESYKRPSKFGVISSTSRPTGYIRSTHTGFLVVRATWTNAEGLAALEFPERLADEDALNAWLEEIGDDYVAEIIVSRDFQGTHADVTEAIRVRAVERREKDESNRRKRESGDREYHAVEAALKSHGVTCDRHYRRIYSDDVDAAYVSVKASTLTALLESLDRQKLSNALVEKLREEFDYGNEGTREARRMIDVVEEFLNEKMP